MRRQILWFCLAAVLAFLPASARAEETLQDQYLKIYLKFNEAEHFERQGDYKNALEDFKDCLTRLQKIRSSDPNWEKVLVSSRMQDCRAMIAELTPKAAAQTPAAPATPADGTGAPPSVGVASDDVNSLKQQLAATNQALESTRAELNSVKAQLQSSQTEVQSLHAQIVTLNQQLAASRQPSNMNDQMGHLMTDNKALTDKLANAEAQIKSLTSGNPKSTVSLLRAQLRNAEEKLAASDAANSALQETTTSLKQDLDQVQASLAAANQKLAAISPNSPEYATIKHENEVMRGILLREQQEQSRRDLAKRLAQEEFKRLKITSTVLQEQLDILGSPMTPPNNDEERILLESLKTSPSTTPTDFNAANGSTFAATNASPATPPATNVAQAPAAPASPAPDTNTASAAPDTNVPATNVAQNPPPPASSPPAPDTNVAPASPATNVAQAPAPPAPSLPDTNPPSTPPDTNAPATNVAQAPAPPASPAPDTNTALAAPDTNAPATNVAQNPPLPATPPAVPTDYSTQPRPPADMQDVAKSALDLFKQGRYDEAANKYQGILDKYPDSLYAWSNLGVVRIQQGKMDEAVKALQQAVKLSPSDAFSYARLGMAYYELNQYADAIDALERALALNPNDARSHNYLGCACSQKGWQEVAEREFRKSIEIDDTYGEAHFNLAIVYATSKPPSIELARRHYNRAIELGMAKNARLEKLLQSN